MKLFPVFAALCCFTAALLTGCDKEKPESSTAEETTTTESTTAETTVTTESTTSTTTTTTHETTTTSTTSTTEETTTTFIEEEPIIIETEVTEATLPEHFEEHADEPDPINFTFRFAPQYIDVRLAGGKYQTFYYDLSAVVNAENDELPYILADFNFDGYLDFCVPTVPKQTNQNHIIYIWNPETLHFNEKPLEMLNPQIRPVSQIISARFRKNTNQNILEMYSWIDGALTIQKRYMTNYRNLTISEIDFNNPATIAMPILHSYRNRAELDSAFLLFDS